MLSNLGVLLFLDFLLFFFSLFLFCFFVQKPSESTSSNPLEMSNCVHTTYFNLSASPSFSCLEEIFVRSVYPVFHKDWFLCHCLYCYSLITMKSLVCIILLGIDFEVGMPYHSLLNLFFMNFTEPVCVCVCISRKSF